MNHPVVASDDFVAEVLRRVEEVKKKAADYVKERERAKEPVRVVKVAPAK